MVRYLGKRRVLSLPKGIMFAATFVPRMLTLQPKAYTYDQHSRDKMYGGSQLTTRRQAKREPPLQYLSMIASKRSHWFQSSRFHALLIAAVERIPNDADKVTAIGLVSNCDHIAPHRVVLQRERSELSVIIVSIISTWHLEFKTLLVINVAVLPMPELIA